MNQLYLDIETRSPTSIKSGVYRYAEKAEILLVSYALDDGPVEVIDCSHSKSPLYLASLCIEYSEKEIEIVAHNSQFDRVLLGERWQGFRWRDTMVKALAHGLPGGLDMLCQIFKLDREDAKDKGGKKLIQLFCKPNKDGSWNTRETHPKEWNDFIKYARQDIVAMRQLDKKLPSWNDERELWYLDQKINGRGFAVDLELAYKAVEACAAHKIKNDASTVELTGGAVNAATQRDAMLKHLLEIHGVNLPDMMKSTLERRLEDPDLPEIVKELIALRLASSGTSTKKYQTLIDSVSSDGRLRGTIQFCGASKTSRWVGRIFQPQNLPRPKLTNEEIEFGIECMKNDCADLFFDDVTEMASSALRGVIVAPEGKKLVISDLSAIEGRVLAWLANEKWKLKAYEDYDKGQGFDMYVLTYARTFGIKPEEVDKKKRQLGKVLELALGYSGGVGAFVTFANGYGINLETLADDIYDSLTGSAVAEAEQFWEYCVEKKKTLGLSKKVFVACDSIKRLWREANPAISALWKNIEAACKASINDGVHRTIGKVTVDKKGTWLRIRLPSGRFLCYAGVIVEDGSIKYLGVNQYSRKWCRLSTYSGKIIENCTQAVARDVFAHGMTVAESEGYNVVLHVHDELITEVPDNDQFSASGLSELMSKQPPWASDLPLAAAGFEAYRYRKD